MRPDRSDVLLVLGAVCLVCGAAQVYPPAGWIVAGLLTMGLGWLVGLGAHSRDTEG